MQLESEDVSPEPKASSLTGSRSLEQLLPILFQSQLGLSGLALVPSEPCRLAGLVTVSRPSPALMCCSAPRRLLAEVWVPASPAAPLHSPQPYLEQQPALMVLPASSDQKKVTVLLRASMEANGRQELRYLTGAHSEKPSVSFILTLFLII